MTPEQLARYARHIVLHEIGGPGQQRLMAARVLVVGAGGLGSPALLYLAAAGVGTLGIVDDDDVALSNLQRQVIHDTAAVGRPKVESAADAIGRLNPQVRVEPHVLRLDTGSAARLVPGYDVVLDGSDNFATRYCVNAACVAAGKPLVAGAMSQWEGQVAVFHPTGGGPCYQCLFPEPPDPSLAPSCAAAGVIGALPGTIGSMMAIEAIKLIARAGVPLRGAMLIYDALHADVRRLAIAARADCPACGGAGA